MTGPSTSRRGRRGRLRSLYVSWLPWILGGTAVANLALTFFLPLTAFPLRPHSDGSLTYLVHTEQPSVDRRFGLYLELGDASAGGVLLVPTGSSFLEPELVEGFAEMEVIECALEPVPAEFDLTTEPTGTFETRDGELLTYWVVPGEAELWWLALLDDGMAIVPETVSPPSGDCP